MTEVIDLLNPKVKCDLWADTQKRRFAVGGLLNDCPIVCGGRGGYNYSNILNPYSYI